MILCPIENKPLLTGFNYIQVRPKISQKFGDDFIRAEDGMLHYASIGLKGHNGIDFAVPIGTPVFAPIDGIVRVNDQGKYGYGLHIKLRNPYKGLEVVLGHLSNTVVLDGKKVYQGDLLGYSGNTGNSTGPHLHFGMRKILAGKDLIELFETPVIDYKNGYFGYFDPLPYLITFKGTLRYASVHK